MAVRFGVQLWQEEFDLRRLRETVSEVEAMGYDSVWIYDHFYPMSRVTGKYIPEAWTLLAYLATESNRIRLGILMSCNSYRPPAILAKIAATVDVISQGRLEFGIGAGWYKEEYDAYGIPFQNYKIRLERLDEAVELIKRVWTQEEANFRGNYYTIKDLASFPKPVQKPHPPIWIGGKGEPLLRIVARHADYANLLGCDPIEYREKLDVLRRQCSQVGRDFDHIRKSWHGIVIVGKKEEVSKKALRFKEESSIQATREMSFENFLQTTITGTPEECIEKMQRYVDSGATYFIPHFPDRETLDTFVEKVVPAFK